MMTHSVILFIIVQQSIPLFELGLLVRNFYSDLKADKITFKPFESLATEITE